MRASTRHNRRLFSAALVGLLLLTAQAAWAENLNEKSLSLRLPAALSRFATYADVAAMGGASAASKWASAVNPASVAWQPIPGDLHLSVSPQYANVAFENGTRLDVAAEALTWDLGEWGVLQPSLAQVRSNRKMTLHGGPEFGMDMDYAQLQWARKVNPDWALGANFNFSKAHTEFEFDPAPVSDTHGETYGFRFGVLNRMAQRLLGGVVLDYAFSPSRTTLYDFMGLGVGDTRTKDVGHQFLLRPGISYEYMNDCTVFADYQLGHFFDDSGSLTVNRFHMGVEHSIVKGVYMRGGVALDANGKAAWTAGIGFCPTEKFSIDVGYQDNMFPELGPEFGRSRTLIVSIGFTF